MPSPDRAPPLWSPVRRLRNDDNRADFDCGSEALTRYFRERAKQDFERRAGTVWVLPGPDAPSGQLRRVVGFYTLSPTGVPLTEIAPEIGKKLARYPFVPAYLIGRLAVDKSLQRRGYGEFLLHHALRRCAGLGDHAAASFVVVDAKDDAAAAWYGKFGFVPSVDNEHKLFLPLATWRRLARR
jgi:GNAT superfamily N-acetyltransferase